jgi:hypothetical protein
VHILEQLIIIQRCYMKWKTDLLRGVVSCRDNPVGFKRCGLLWGQSSRF